jgi:inner membrane protein
LKDPKLPPRWGLLFLYACLAGLSHILLDFTNNYGVRPFWPFSEKWYSWDIVFIAEPVMWVLLTLGLVVPAFFGLIDREIGARHPGPRGRVAATLALVGIVFLWGLRDYEHRRAVNALQSRTYNGADPLRASAYPKYVDPFHWDGVVETPAFFALASVNSLTPEVDPEGRLEIRYKPEETPVTLAAKNSYVGRRFLDWAQYPIAETETLQPPQQGWIVLFQDLRYSGVLRPFTARPGRGGLSKTVEIDKNLHVVGDVFQTTKGQVIVPEPGQP